MMQPMETAPRDGTYVILFADSGYVNTPFRCAVCRYYPLYRPLAPWVTHSNDSFEEDDSPAIGWTPLLKEPKC